MSFTTASAILRGKWLLDKESAQAHMPMVVRLMKGEAVDFGTQKIVNELTHISFAGSNTKVYNVRTRTDLSTLAFGSIAMVTLSGPMLKNGDYCADGMLDQAQLINRLAASENIAGIILNIDSPGGQADGTALLAGAIKEADARKPVLGIIDDGMAASAAMWFASATRELFCTQPTDRVGSIGVYTTIADWASYYESLGLKTKDIYAPQSTDKNKGYYDAINGDETLIKQDLSVLADQFINSIATNRAGKIKGNDWKTGKMYYADEAKKIGLIDGIKSLSQVVDRMSTLISQKQKSTNSTMAFEKTLVAAKANEFAVTDEGFSLSEDQLNNVEASLAESENGLAVASAAIAVLEGSIATANTLATTQETTMATMGTAATEAGTTISTQAARIIALEAEVVVLGAQSSGKGTKLSIKEDQSSEVEKTLSYLDDNSPINQFADKRLKRKQS